MTKDLHWKELPDNLKDRIIESPVMITATPNMDKIIKLEKRSKYGNTKVEYDGRTFFDSKKECEVYKELLLRIKAGELVKVECQYPLYYWVKFSLPDENKSFEKRYAYIADFRIEYPDGHAEIWDVKGGKFLTREFKHKRMIIRKLYGIEIKIV